jgi:hypothetical protein
MSQKPDQTRKYRLEFATHAALGQVSPELAWEQLQTLVQQAIADEYEGSESLRLRFNLPVDLTNLTELLAIMNPVCGMNEFHYINPRIPLRNLMSVNPLRALEAVLRIYTVSDRYQAPPPQL